MLNLGIALDLIVLLSETIEISILGVDTELVLMGSEGLGIVESHETVSTSRGKYSH